MKGFGTLADPALAKMWLERASGLGSPDAMFELYRLYEMGAKPNAREAERWLRQAAQSGHPGAMYRLAIRYQRGASEQDRASAREWLEKAAQAGHSQAAKALQKQGTTAAEPG
jgi:TPR repeat protein